MSKVRQESKKYVALRDEIIRLEQRIEQVRNEYITLLREQRMVRKMLRQQLEKNEESVKTYREWLR